MNDKRVVDSHSGIRIVSGGVFKGKPSGTKLLTITASKISEEVSVTCYFDNEFISHASQCTECATILRETIAQLPVMLEAALTREVEPGTRIPSTHDYKS